MRSIKGMNHPVQQRTVLNKINLTNHSKQPN